VGYRDSTLTSLSRVRARGQQPWGPVIVGGYEAREWANRNLFFYVDERDLTDDLTAFTGLGVVWRTPKPDREKAQHLALTATHVALFDIRTRKQEYICA
jgi:hypothetical protein